MTTITLERPTGPLTTEPLTTGPRTTEPQRTEQRPTELSDLAKSIIELADAVGGLRQQVGAAYGVSESELRAAVRIATQEFVTPRILADQLRLSGAAVTAIADHLVDRDIAVRAPNPRDRRSVLLTLTERGQRMVQEELTILDTSLTSAASDLAAIRASSAVLSEIASNVNPIAHPKTSPAVAEQ